LRGAVSVPMDAIASPEFARRVADEAKVRLAVIARSLPAIEGIPTLILDDLRATVSVHVKSPYNPPKIQREDMLEIVFTSGTTAEPRGVVLTHGNILSGLEPIEAQNIAATNVSFIR